MKHLYKISILLLLALLLPVTAIAYDFEVDGIYYNKTSANTVKVTYGNINEFSYGETVVIPSTVVYDGTNYDVTAIGDSSFFTTKTAKRSYLKSITIPESVITIGKDAFSECIGLTDVTCLALVPPINDGNFSIHEFHDEYYYDHYWTWYLFEVDMRPWTILHVPLGACDAYKGTTQWSKYFNFVIPIGAEKTEPPVIDAEITSHNGNLSFWTITAGEESSIYCSRKTGRSNGFNYGDNYNYHTWNKYEIGSYGYEDTHVPQEFYDFYSSYSFYVDINAFAIDEGKEPSQIVSSRSICWFWDKDNAGNPYFYIIHSDTLSNFREELFDIIVDGICYNIIGDSKLEVAPDVYKRGLLCDNYYQNTTLYNDQCYVGYIRYGYYNGAVEIPSQVEYNGKIYDVTGIHRMAFCGDQISDPHVGYQGHCNYSYPYYEIDGCDINRISIPVSVTHIGESALPDYGLETVYITGNGEWQAGALPETVNTLYIGSGVTSVKGMHVNPVKIYSYATTPPVCDENSFTGYDAELHVPASSLAAYFTAPYWSNFTNIIGDAVAVTNLALNQDTLYMNIGEQITLSATVTPTNAMPNVSWESSRQYIATVDNGVVSAIRSGECDIIATCQDKQAVCHVVVSEILPTEVTLNQEDAMIEVGSQLTLTATVLPENATNQTVTWTTTNSTVATVNNGVVTAVGPGECNIVATCGNKQAICHVIVVEQFIYITLDEHDTRLLPNHIISLTPTITPVATDLVVTSSNPEVAAARLAGGKIQVVGIAEGIASIRVSSADGYAFSDSCIVEVYTERGDVNCDGFVNISDATSLIDALLDGSTVYSTENADCNNDGNVTITDLTMLIDALLGGTALPDKDSEIITVNGVSFKMVKVPGGTFTMGGTAGQGDQTYGDEFPLHEVTLSSFSIGETEVTQALWQAVMGSNPSNFTGDLNRPVEMVNWSDCQTFIAKLNQMTGMSFRLPTEAEWEYAARGGKKSHDYMFAGSNDLDEVAWAITNIPSQQPNTTGYGTQPVAQKAPNELGLYDMSGNVYEWCHDWYDAYPAEAQVNPTGPGDDEGCHYRVSRGGGWNRYARSSRVTLRNNVTPESTYFNIGLRLVK